jgi:tetratricopeptide (TPR) repeat protein
MASLTAAEPPPVADRAADCDELIAASLERVFDDPAGAVRAGSAAVQLAAALAVEADDPAAVDRHARALAYLANAERVAADYEAAERAMARATDRLAAGSGDERLRARVGELRASLERDTGHPEHAVRSLRRAGDVYRQLGERTDLGRVLVQQGVLLAHVGDTAKSLEALRQAFEVLRPREDPRSVLAATQCLAYCLHTIGYDIAAAQLVHEAAAVVERHGDRVTLLRLRWLGARIQIALGHDGEAQLKQVRDGLLERGLVYDAALVCLDLATGYARCQRLPDLRHLAQEMFPIFTSREIHREALAALILLRDTLSTGRADLALLDELRTFLERSRFDRRLRFRAS